MKLMLCGLLGISFLLTPLLNAEEKLAPIAEDRKVFIEWFHYEDYLYSNSQKTEAGDKVKMDAAIRYQYSPDTFARFRFETDPLENRQDNKTSKFELLLNHRLQPLQFQVDLDLNTNVSGSNSDNSDRGGISLGPDLDSKGTFLSYQATDNLSFTFYPYNFDGVVGETFNTWDVTRIYFVEGTPSTVSGTQSSDEEIGEKTIPGLEAKWRQGPWQFYLGAGMASYLYPANDNFDITNNPSANRWVKHEDFGYKFGLNFRQTDYRLEVKYVAHTQASETGALLESAGSVVGVTQQGPWRIKAEGVMSKAGGNAYRLDDNGEWFEETTPFDPIYSDIYRARQNWLGKRDYAGALRVGYQFNNLIPFISYKYQGEYFIFRERESAHRLRTFDEKQSHGGLQRFGLGANWTYQNYMVRPEIEWYVARNSVFGNSSDLRDDRFLSQFRKDDFVLYLTLTYNFEDTKGLDL